MARKHRPSEISHMLLHTTSRVGPKSAARRLSLDSNALTRISRGSYLPSTVWQSFNEKDRHIARALAAHHSARRPTVFSHLTAAILHGLPIYGAIPNMVHVTGSAEQTTRPTAGVLRHRMSLRPNDVVHIAGVRCTSVERTLIDLACTALPEVSLAAIDGYLRREFKVEHLIDWSMYAEWQAEMGDRLGALRGARGVRKARFVFGLADPRIDSVLESLSHLQLRRLGFDVALQVPVPSPKGASYYVDFEFIGLRLFGECDGKDKYVNALLRAGLSAEEILYREKRRQDWICGTTKKNLIRWGYPDVATALTLARRLHAFGVPIPSMPS